MWEWLVEWYRRGGRDAAKARAALARQADQEYREAMADYDAFVPVMEEMGDPSIQIGAAADSAGQAFPVRLGLEELAHHALVIGGTGTGKTTFVTSLVAQALGHDSPVGVVDFKSDFFRLGLEWAGATAWTLEPNARQAFIDRIVVVNPFADDLIPLNVCRPIPGTAPEVQAYEVALALSRLFDASIGFQMENILRHLLLLLMEAGLSLVEAPLVLQDELLRTLLVEKSQSPAVAEFFRRTYPGVPAGSKDAIIARLQALLLPENFRLMLGADEMADFKGVLDHGDPMFVFLGKGPGAPEEQVEVMGSLLLQLLFQAAFAGSGRRRPYQLGCDEFFHLLDTPALGKRFETALTTLRSFGVHLTLVMHNFGQVPGSLREAMLANCDLMALFRTSSRNAQFFGDFLPELDPELVRQALRRTGRIPGRHEIRSQLVERLQRLPNRTCYWYDRRKPYRALLLTVPEVPAPHVAAGTSETELDRFITESGIRRGRIALSKSALRSQIEARARRIAELLRPTIVLADQVGEAPDARSRKSTRPRLG